MVIGGLGFDPDPANNEVRFGGVVVPVLQAQSVELAVELPELSAGPTLVTVRNLVTQVESSPINFNVLKLSDGVSRLILPGANLE